MDGCMRTTDIFKNTWLIRNPEKQSEWVEIQAWSIPINNGHVSWEDANGQVLRDSRV